MSSLNSGLRFTAFFLLALGVQMLFFSAETAAQTELKTLKADLNRCVELGFEKTNYVFQDATALEAVLFKPGNSIKECRETVKSLDFAKNTLLGIDIYNSECHSFPLEYKVLKDEPAKLYRFQISHPPVKSNCAGMTHHELWVLAAKLPAGYGVDFEISEKNPTAQREGPFGREIALPPPGLGMILPGCLYIGSMVYNRESLKKLLSFEQCSKIFNAGQFDLERQTVIGYSIGGDCHMHVENKLYRNDKEKLYTLVTKNMWGGCRAGGWRHGLYTIPRIPSDYRVKFVKFLVDDYNDRGLREAGDSGEIWTAAGQKLAAAAPPSIAEPGESSPPAGGGEAAASADGVVLAATGSKDITLLETRQIDIKDCIHLNYKSYQSVIRDDDTFQKAIRTDGSEDFCKKNLEKIDFSKNTLLGINLNTGYCGTPPGLETKAFRDDEKKLVTLQVSYLGPHGICRALSSYDLWVLLPKIPEGYETRFEVAAKSQ